MCSIAAEAAQPAELAPCKARASSSGFAKIALLLRAAVLLFVAVGCRTAPAPESTTDRFHTMDWEPDWSVTNLGPGDVLRATVKNHPELSTPEGGAALDERGALALPVIGDLVVGGLTMGEAGQKLRNAYAEYMKTPDVTLSMVQRESAKFFIVGQIREPGPRTLERPTTALEAVSQGGFFLNAADRKNCFLVRPHGSELEVHRFNAETPGRGGLVQVHPGDIVFVRRRGSQRFQEEFLPLLAPFTIAAPIVAAGTL